jgi:hypothetical protein
MKNLKNEDGYVIVMTLMILSILTVIGLAGIRTSITETNISTNHLIYHMNFYAAESGIAIGPLWAGSKDNYPETEWGNVDFVGESDIMNHSNGTEFDFEVTPQVRIDPADGVEKVLRYGDSNADFLDELNFTSGRPLIEVVSDGTHTGRGGLARIKATYAFAPAFVIPEAALWVENADLVDFKGNATVVGDSSDESVCSDVPDMVYHQSPLNPVDIPKNYGDSFDHALSGGMYPYGPVKDSLTKRADYIGDTFPTSLAEASTADNPVIIILTGDIQINNEDLKVPAYGVLYIDGNLRINGDVEWNGLIVTTGDATVGNGTANIKGSLVTGENADVELTGTIVVQYDCSTLNVMFDKFSGYRMTSWRQI